jgi:bacterioferritin-associated ferredoxin
MDNTCPRETCDDCPGRFVCHCLQVTEQALRFALTTLDLRTLRDIREKTGAGDGCTACHHRLKRFLDEFSYSPEPICSVR